MEDILFKNYLNKKVLITGHTGFKGSWLSTWLLSLGANVVGVSNNVPTIPSNFVACGLGKLINDYRLDIKDQKALQEVIKNEKPDYIFHLAAQAIVSKSYSSPLDTINSNAIGTVNLLECLKQENPTVNVVMITSDKAYDNVEWIWGYRENDAIGGKDPYSASKGMAELAIKSYSESFFKNFDSNVKISVARAGNVIGGGDWAQDRIIPDCVKSWSKNQSVEIRNPESTRPWQHVLEPLSGYLLLGQKLNCENKVNHEAYNFGPNASQNQCVRDLIKEMTLYWENVKWKDTSNGENFHEARLLKLNCDKALHDLHWEPVMNFHETVRMTVEWYRNFYNNSHNSILDFTDNQIKEYISLAKKKKINWAQG